jgi:hypothetical protein
MSEDVFSNILADEFLPGVMYPFNWSVLAGIVDASWNRIRRDLRVEGEDLQFVRTFYHHAYWNVSRLSAVLRSAEIPQVVIDRLFESPVARELFTLDESAADRVLAIDRSAITQNLEQSIVESERRLEEIRRRQGEWESEEELVREFDQIIEIDGEVIFKETSAWLLVGLNLSLLDEWTGREGDVRRRKLHREAVSVRMSEPKLEEVRSMIARYRSHWELSRSVRAMGRGLAEERLLALGDRFVKWNLLGTKEDVRYLTVHEVRQIVSGGCSTNTCNNYALRARVRRTEIDQHAVDILPRIIRGNAAPLLPWMKNGRHPRTG